MPKRYWTNYTEKNNMKHLRTLDEHINESQLNEATFEVSYTVKSKVSYNGEQFDTQAEDMGDDPQEVAQMMASDIGLVKGNMIWTGTNLNFSGSNTNGTPILIQQSGEYNMYGGPYIPKMGKPKATLGGKNVVGAIMKAFKSYGWTGDVDMGRTDIYGYVFNK